VSGLGHFAAARILVVDDQESNVLLLERLLERWGYSDVTSTTNSRDVPDLYAQTDPDLLLLDLQMPAPDGLELLEQLPVCVRLARQLHGVLLEGVRGEDKRPGELRDRQVWIAPAGTPIESARFVPPPAERVPDLLADWERFVNGEELMPPLVRCALMHYQFEAIHPFNDGNGRIGRLLIPLLLMELGVLSSPLLYLSAYFDAHRPEYYDHLYRVSTTGEWQPWLRFFLEGVAEQSRDAIERSRRIRALEEAYRQRLHDDHAPASALRLSEDLFIRPVMRRSDVAAALEMTVAGARNVLDRLVRLGILRAEPGTYPQLYVAHELIEVLT